MDVKSGWRDRHLKLQRMLKTIHQFSDLSNKEGNYERSSLSKIHSKKKICHYSIKTHTHKLLKEGRRNSKVRDRKNGKERERERQRDREGESESEGGNERVKEKARYCSERERESSGTNFS